MGTVYLIGAGPGDPGLYTIKAKEIIQCADAIVYDYLANEVFLDWIKPDCEVIYAGKRGGDHTLSQQQINELLVKLARSHDIVVRLKGGDPFIFGRGGEEAEYLVDNGVKFEVIPGVTSATAASAYAGIPLTHREYSSSVTFVTGHEAETKDKSAIHWERLARPASTLVFFMGVKNLPIITKRLIDVGMSKDTPSALIRWGTTCKQQVLISKLESIADDAKKLKFKPPALLIVGDVVNLRDKLMWFEKRPLLGKNIIITRSRSQASGLARILNDLGACCIQFPTIKIQELEDYTRLYKEIQNLKNYDWIIFTSVNGVEIFFKKLFELGLDSRHLSGVKVCAIGPATEKSLKNYSIFADLVPKKFVAESILESFKNLDVRNKKFLIPRAYEARETVVEGLKELKAEVNVVPVYKTVLDGENKDLVIEKIKSQEVDYITFTSSSTVKNFFKLIPKELIHETGKFIKFCCIGPITAKTLEDFGFKTHIMPDSYTISGLINKIIDFESKKQ